MIRRPPRSTLFPTRRSSDLALFLDTRTLNVSGTTTFGNATGGSYLYLVNGAVVNNKAGATWNIVNGKNGRAHVCTPNTEPSPTPSYACTKKMTGGTSDTVNVAFNNMSGATV